jgi:hypothetical protein
MDDNEEYILERDGKYYIFAKTYKIKFINDAFMDYINEFFSEMNGNPQGSNFTIVVGTCYSYHNWRSRFQDEMVYNSKLRVIKNRLPIRYVISDRNFVCDEEMLNAIFDSILNKFINKDKVVYANNWTPIKWVFIRNIPEDDLANIVKLKHADVEVYPIRKSNFIQDINRLVYSDIKSKHRITKEIKKDAMHIYDFMTKEKDE